MSHPEDIPPSESVGTSVQRREDPALVSSDAEFTDDIQIPGGVHLALCRSRYGHARIEAVDASGARTSDGVVAVYTAGDVDHSGAPGGLRVGSSDRSVPAHPLLARETAVYQGQPVAAVVAEDRYAARDAAEQVDIAYERLPAVVDPEAALAGDAPTVHDSAPDNVAFEWDTGDEAAAEAALAGADRTVTVDVGINCVLPTAMEPRAAVAHPDGSDLSVALSTQNPHWMRTDLSETLGVPEDRLEVHSPDVGGGFGGKLQPYPGYLMTAWAALQLERPVKWTATRTEDLQSTIHSREHRVSAQVGVAGAGDIRGLRLDTVAPVGGYLVSGGSVVLKNLGLMANSQYEIPGAYVHTTGVFTNTTPMSAYRGAGRPEATYVVERLVREVAAELGSDPVELRRRNFVEEFPYETGLGRTCDSGDYEKTLGVALDHVDYGAFRERQTALREEGRYVGIGVSAYVEACGVGPGISEFGSVELTPSGEAVVRAGTAEIGTGHRTGYAQVVSAELGLPVGDVEVVEGDTAATPEGTGTFGSRAIPVAGSALRESAATVRERAREVAACHLEASVDDVAFDGGEFHVRGAPGRSVSIAEMARLAHRSDGPNLAVDVQYDPPNYTFPFGTHVAVVEVDPETGEIAVERYVAVDDVGTQINPAIVEGQIHGGVAQGIGQALYEETVYDDNGTLLTGSLQDYTLPRAEHIPEIEWDSTVTECPHNPLGVKGVGEAGAIAAPPAVVNAVVDALDPLGVADLEMPLTPERVWRAIRGHGS
jgi:carbon-monoxide dehydrogenase large subunit